MNYNGGLASIMPLNPNATRSERPSWGSHELEDFKDCHFAYLNFRGGETMVIWFPDRKREPLDFHHPRY